jgi:GGDEF domain-containing protein
MLGVLLHGADAEGAAVFAERLRSVAAERLVHPSMDGQRLRVTVGIAIIGEGVPLAALDEAFAAAEAALSTAQGDGGDRVVMAAAPPSRSAGLPQ